MLQARTVTLIAGAAVVCMALATSLIVTARAMANQANAKSNDVVRARRIEICRPDGSVAIVAAADSDSATLEFKDEKGQSRIKIATGAQSGAAIRFHDRTGTLRVMAGAEPFPNKPDVGYDFPRVSVYSSSGRTEVATLRQLGPGGCLIVANSPDYDKVNQVVGDNVATLTWTGLSINEKKKTLAKIGTDLMPNDSGELVSRPIVQLQNQIGDILFLAP